MVTNVDIFEQTIASTFTMAPEDFLKDGEFVKLEMESSAESVDKIVAEINPKTP